MNKEEEAGSRQAWPRAVRKETSPWDDRGSSWQRGQLGPEAQGSSRGGESRLNGTDGVLVGMMKVEIALRRQRNMVQLQ